jgi:hypothetical protein
MRTDVDRHLPMSGWWPEGISHRLSKTAKIGSAISTTYDPYGMTLLTRNSSKGLSESPISDRRKRRHSLVLIIGNWVAVALIKFFEPDCPEERSVVSAGTGLTQKMGRV